MNCWVLLALKTLDHGKSRLAGVLSPAQRAALIRTMLDHVLAALQASRQIAGIAIVTQETRALPAAAALALPDPGLGLNSAIASGARTLAALGARELLVLHPDLPLLRPDEIDAFIARGRQTGLALAPDRRGSGTNAVFVSPPNRFDFCFGRSSFERHVRLARKHGLEPAIVRLPGFAFDIDEPADLAALLDDHGDQFAFAFDSRSSTTWTTRSKDCSPLPAAEHG